MGVWAYGRVGVWACGRRGQVGRKSRALTTCHFSGWLRAGFEPRRGVATSGGFSRRPNGHAPRRRSAHAWLKSGASQSRTARRERAEIFALAGRVAHTPTRRYAHMFHVEHSFRFILRIGLIALPTLPPHHFSRHFSRSLSRFT
jgi:hypothetical protein